jgi:hypothetical protein
MPKRTHADLTAITENLSPGLTGRGRRSPLFRWLFDRADTFQRLLEDKRPSWSAITKELSGLNLANGSGQPLTPRRVQRTWYAVVRVKGWDKPPLKPVPLVEPPAPAVMPSIALTTPRLDPVRPQRPSGSKIVFTPIAPTYGNTNE